MLIIPESTTVTRSEKSEQVLTDKCRTWLTQDERKEGLHASDLLDPRMAYFKRKFPQEMPDRLVNMFIVGKFAHAIVLSAVDGVEGISLASDGGSVWSEDLGIWYSPDKTINGIPRELKTTRSFFEAKTEKDLELYRKQLGIYMVAEKSTIGQMWVLYMNLKEDGKSSPQWRVFTDTWTEEALEQYRQCIKATVKVLNEALATNDPSKLGLCAKFKCGKGNCDFWEQCQPVGRYGVPKSKWEKD
jgi:hypothetical protein